MTRNLEIEIKYFLGKLKGDFNSGNYRKCVEMIGIYEGENKQQYLETLNQRVRENKSHQKT